MPEGILNVTTSIVLLGLVAIWGAYLAVWWRDNRGSALRSSDMIDSFSQQLGSLGSSAGFGGSAFGSSAGLCPRSIDQAARRRRLVVAALGSMVLVTLVLSFVVGTAALLANVVVDMAFVWYCYAIVQRRNLEAEREMKVTMLRSVPAPIDLEERRTVNA